MSNNPSAQQCPSCGQHNQCSLADPRTATQNCWCFSAHIDSAVIAALPAAQRDLACLCPACAQTIPPATTKPQR